MLVRTHPTTAAFAAPGARPRDGKAPCAPAKGKRETPRSGAAKPLLAAAAAIVAAWTLYAAPQARRPALAALRPLLGAMLPAEPSVKIGEVRARRMEVDGQTVLYIEGSLWNTGKRLRKAPALRVTLVGDDGQPLYSWKSKATKAEIEPAGEIPFQTRLLSPPEKFKSIAITMGGEG
jgi:hypothetical protein